MTPSEELENDPFMGPLRADGRPGARRSLPRLYAAAGLVLVVGVASWSAGVTHHQVGVRKVERIIQEDNDRSRDRRDDRRRDKEKEKAKEKAKADADLEDEGFDLGNVTDVSSGEHIIEGCVDDTADFMLLTDGFAFDFEMVGVTFSSVEDGTVIVDSACKAFDFTIQNKSAKFTMNGLLNVLPDDAEGEDGMSVTSPVPLAPGVPFVIRVLKGTTLSSELLGLCIQVYPDLRSADDQGVTDNYTAESTFSGDMREPTCSYWSGSEGLYQMLPAGGLTFGPDQGRRLQATTTPSAAETTPDGAANAATTLLPAAPAGTTPDGAASAATTSLPAAPAGTTTDGGDSSNSSAGGELPDGWTYEQTVGEIPVRIDLPGLSYDNLTSNEELSGKVAQAISEAIAIEGSWSLTQSNVDQTFMNASDGVTALVTAKPARFDNFIEFYQNLANSQLSKTVTSRLQQIPGIKAACKSDPCDFTAIASPFLEAANCKTFRDALPYEKSQPALFCVGQTCADVCYPDTKCDQVICRDAMKTKDGSADTTCEDEDDCMDTCCVVTCDSWGCPTETCGKKTGITEAKLSEANETCCVAPEVECCRANNSFCEACRECVDISELCAQSLDDPSCEVDEAPDCGLLLTSQFDTNTSKAMFSTAVIFGGTRAFSGGYGTASSGEEYRAWVWEIRTGKKVMSFGTDTPVITVAASADGLHALTGEQSGMTKVWNYVQGGPAYKEHESDSAGPVVGIAGGFNHHQSYVTTGSFVTFWNWGTDGTFKAPTPPKEKEKDALEEEKGELGLDSGEQNELLALASPKEPSSTQEALKAGIMSMTEVTAVVQLPGNSNFVSGNAHGVIRYFGRMTMTVLQQFPGHIGKVTAFSAFPTGTSLLSGGEDGKIILWNIATGEKKREWVQPFGGAVRTLQQVHNGAAFLVGSDDGFIRKYDLKGGKTQQIPACKQDTGGGAIYNIAANPGNPSQIITSSKDGVARVFKL